MTVNELRRILQGLDGDMLVVAAKFEMGFAEISEHRIVDLVLHASPYSTDSLGPHELKENTEFAGHQVCKALLLGELEPSLTGTRDKKPAIRSHK